MSPRIFLVALPLLLTTTRLQAQSAPADSVATSERTLFTVVETPPMFKGGNNRIDWYFQKNMRYPEAARQARLEGTVFVRFIVTDQGVTENASVVRSLSPELDAEAVRLIQAMPKWHPGKQNGRAVNVYYNLPVRFRL